MERDAKVLVTEGVKAKALPPIIQEHILAAISAVAAR